MIRERERERERERCAFKHEQKKHSWCVAPPSNVLAIVRQIFPIFCARRQMSLGQTTLVQCSVYASPIRRQTPCARATHPH